MKTKVFFPRVWEYIDGVNTQRIKVFGGWVVWSGTNDHSECMVFVPDPDHKWLLSPEPSPIAKKKRSKTK